MMQIEQSEHGSRNSSTSSDSTDNTTTQKESPYKNTDEDSGASFTYLKPPSSEQTTLRDNTGTLPGSVCSVSQGVPTTMYSPCEAIGDICYLAKHSTPTLDGSMYGIDAVSEMYNEDTKEMTKKNMTGIYSIIYGILLIVMGGIIYLNHQSQQTRHVSELFSVCISLVGMSWLAFFHADLFRYKQKVLRRMMGSNSQIDKISTCTNFNLALTFLGNENPPYRFLTGRHSGSFYLKIGLAAFCFGHLINEGLLLGQQIIDYLQEDRYRLNCGELSSLITHIIKPLYSFYQLFIIFKYSNIVINRYKALASFGLIHIMATCLCFWFGTIVEDALEDYHHKLGQFEKLHKNITILSTSDHALCSHANNDTQCECVSTAILSINNVQAIPYLYPFTIEFNLLLAGVWFIVWQNVGKDHYRANPHHFQHKIHKNDGVEEVTYQSNLVISADCHASNKGLFAGLFLLMASIISIIIFFVAMSNKEHHFIGLAIHYCQEGMLTLFTLCGVLIAYRQLSKLNFNPHPIHFLDDVLLVVPLPFYFIQAILTIMSEYQNRSIIRVVMAVLIPIQVILQTPLIIDGLRRCSNTSVLRFKKPGREVITFLIVCNLTMWIINTFEAKSVESHYGQDAYFGEFLWMFVSHTTLPLMLFYRFHSSVCLADIWKSAYEKGE